jgi:hypothetical protein
MTRIGIIENITHVAEAGEDRGRLVMQVRASTPNPIAVAAVMHLAQAFGASVETLLIEDEQLFDLSGYAFAREITLTGRSRDACSRDAMAERIATLLRAARRDIERAAAAADVAHVARLVHGDPWRELAVACLERGPWNIVALTDPLGLVDVGVLEHILRHMPGATGVIVVGPKARRIAGPIVLVIEDALRLAQKLNLAERIAAHGDRPIVILPLGVGPEHIDVLDTQIRLALEDHAHVTMAAGVVTLGSSAAAAQALRQFKPGFVIAELGRVAVPLDEALRPLIMALECPLLLVR